MSEGNVANDIPNRSGSMPVDGECSACGGSIWEYDGDTVCTDCSIIHGSGRARSTTSQWDQFFDDRSEHWNSEATRCVGGFPWVYEWVTSDELDGSVRDLAATKFYE